MLYGGMFCIDAMVSIKGRNFMPEWGFFNRSIGTFKDIVYRDGQSPLLGHLPLDVLVDVALYSAS